MTKAKVTALRYVTPAVVVGVLIAGGAIGAQTLSRPKAAAQGASTAPAKAPAAKAPTRLPGYSADRNAYYGDLHVHTQLSFDAYIFNVRRTPDDAYRFAKGEAIGHAQGYEIRLAGGPLDFVAVTDHAEYIGAIREAGDPNSPLSKLPVTQGLFSPDPAAIREAFTRVVTGFRNNSLPAEFDSPAIVSKAWGEIRDAAARHNAPGRFTTSSAMNTPPLRMAGISTGM
jgi:hypothetical protein